MILFVVAAAISFGAFVGTDLQKQIPFWAPAVALFALSIGREPSVWFLVLFILPTMILGVAALFRRVSPTPFLIFALSDIVLGIAFSIYQSRTALWTLPEVGQWGPAGAVVAAAAIFRLGGATVVSDHKEGGLVVLGWWQGAMLAYWAGGPAVAVLVGGAIVLWGASAYYSASSLTGLTIAGGAVAIAAGLDAGLLGILSIGLAGTALALGERLVSVWAVGILPLSLVATLSIPGGQLIAIPALLLPGAWAAMSGRLSAMKPSEDRLEVTSTAAAVVGVAYLAALGESVVVQDAPTSAALGGLPLSAVGALWLVYGACFAGGIAAAFSGGGQRTQPMYQQYERAGSYSEFDDLLTKLVPPVGWFSFAVAIVVTIRLLVAGFGTGFL